MFQSISAQLYWFCMFDVNFISKSIKYKYKTVTVYSNREVHYVKRIFPQDTWKTSSAHKRTHVCMYVCLCKPFALTTRCSEKIWGHLSARRNRQHPDAPSRRQNKQSKDQQQNEYFGWQKCGTERTWMQVLHRRQSLQTSEFAECAPTLGTHYDLSRVLLNPPKPPIPRGRSPLGPHRIGRQWNCVTSSEWFMRSPLICDAQADKNGRTGEILPARQPFVHRYKHAKNGIH